MKKGIQADIYSRGYSDILSPIREAKKVTVIGENSLITQHEPNEEAPAVVLVRRTLSTGPYIHAQPEQPGIWAFGGRYIDRLNGISTYPIPLHDRNMDLESR